MEFQKVVKRRQMVRSFSEQPVDPAVVSSLLEMSMRAPGAGNTAGNDWVVLEGSETVTYWENATTPAWRAQSNRYPGLSRAPVVALCVTSPDRYVNRYGEPDKAGSGLGPATAGGSGMAGWSVPYWFGDAAFASMLVLLGAADAGIGACFLGNFRGESAVLKALKVPPGWRLFGTVLLGHPDGLDHPSASLDRPRPAPAERIHRGRWQGTADLHAL